jgi:hypothetical protein
MEFDWGLTKKVLVDILLVGILCVGAIASTSQLQKALLKTVEVERW